MNTTASVPNGTNGTTSTSTSSANHATRTILRIKRRRTEHPIPCIRLEGLVDNPGASGASKVSATGGKVSRKRQQHEEEGEPSREASRRASSSKRSSAAMWKRVLHDDSNENNNDGNGAWNANDNNTGSYRIVDAVFTNTNANTNAGRTGEAGEGFGGGEAANGPSSNKRRKLTLLDCSTVVSEESPLLWSLAKNPAEQSRTRTRRKAPLKVLDPWTRIVDDQLRSVQQGTTTPEAHYRQLTTDPKFTFRDSVEKCRYLGWRLEDGTNLLHCCALWNDPSTASEVLRTCGQGSWTNPASASNARLEWMEQVDGDGRTPYELAKLIGHDRVCEVLEVYGGDTSNYVYDVFYLENNDDSDLHEASNGNPADSGDGGTISEPLGYVDAYGNNNILTAELSSGVGYWTPEGDLVFETAADDDPSGRFLGNNDGYDDDDADSNCEDHGANDYPEHDADEFDLQHQHGYDDYRGYHPSNNLDREDAESNGNYGGTPDGYGRYGWDHGYHNPGDHDEYDDGYGECEYEYDWEQDLH